MSRAKRKIPAQHRTIGRMFRALRRGFQPGVVEDLTVLIAAYDNGEMAARQRLAAYRAAGGRFCDGGVR